MANNKANKMTMDFNIASLCLDRNLANIKPFNMFNKRNSPVFGGNLNPYYTKKRISSQNSKTGIDSNGNVWHVSNGVLYKNDISVGSVARYCLSKETITDRYIFSQSNYPSVGKIECYQNESSGNWYVKNESENVIDLGHYTGDMVATFEKIPATSTRAAYIFVVWYYITGRVYIKYIDASTMTVYHTEDSGKNSLLKYTADYINKPFINAGSLAINGAAGHIIGISLFPQSGSKILPTKPATNVIVSSDPEASSFGVTIWDRQTTSGSSNIQLVKGTDISDVNVKVYNNFGFFPYQWANDTYMGGSSYLYRPCYLGCYDYVTSGITAEDFAVFQGPVNIKSVALSNGKHTFTVDSLYYHYDTTVLQNGFFSNEDIVNSISNARTVLNPYNVELLNVKSKIANSFTLYHNYYKQFAALWKNKTTDQNIFLSMEFTPGNLYFGRGVSIYGENDPSTMYCVYNGLGDSIDSLGIGLPYTLLINEGEISGINATYDKLITPWFDIDDSEFPCIGSDSCFYKSIDGKRYKITSSSNLNGVKNVIDNRFIVLLNGEVYDAEKETFFDYNIGYNNKIVSGVLASKNTLLPPDDVEAYGIGRDVYQSLVASTINNHYEVTEIPFTGTQWPVQRLYGFLGVNIKLISTNRYQYAELYLTTSKDSTVPYYNFNYTLVNGQKLEVNDKLVDLTYAYSATNPIYSLSLFSEYIESYNRNDFILDGYRAYPIIYSNNNIIFAYMALSFIENVKDVFVIQGTVYMIVDNYILRVVINNYQIVASEVIVKTNGFLFCGASLKQAILFSPVKKSFFAFTGDIVLNEIAQANVIKELYYSDYIQSIDCIVMSIKEYDDNYYLYFFKNGIFSYKMPVSTFIDKVISTNTASILVHYIDNSVEELTLEYDENFVKHKIELQTAFFGVGNENTQILDCWYFRIFSDDLPINGKFAVKQNTLTNTGITSMSKTVDVKSGMFDALTKTLLIRFQPKFQAAVGFQIEIESDYPIYEITASFNPDTTQTSKVNI